MKNCIPTDIRLMYYLLLNTKADVYAQDYLELLNGFQIYNAQPIKVAQKIVIELIEREHKLDIKDLGW